MKHRSSTSAPQNRLLWPFPLPESSGTLHSAIRLTSTFKYSFRVYDILSGKSEAEKILYRDPSPEHGYVILPDMKWDLTTVGSLYLVAIVLTDNIRSLRDLRKRHVPMLKNIQREATRVVKEKWGLGDGSLRFYIHYQPSYCE